MFGPSPAYGGPLGPGGMLPGGGATSGGGTPFVQGEWDWMQNPMMMSALMGAGGMLGQQQQQPMFQAPQLGPMPMGRTTPVQLPPAPQTPMPQQAPPWYRGGMFSG